MSGTIAYLLLVVITLSDVRDQLGEGVAMSFSDVAKHPDVFLGGALVAAFGPAAYWLGMRIVKRALGPERQPPRSAVIAVMIPAAGLLGCLGSTLLSGHMVIPALMAGPAVAMAGLLPPVILVATATLLLGMAIRQDEQRQTFVDADELPRDAVEYFDSVDAEAIEAGLERVGNLRYDSSPGRCRRLWTNASRTVYASASWAPSSNGVMHDFSASSQTDDGKYYETSNLVDPQFTVPVELARQFVHLPGATPRQVLSRHYRTLAECLEIDGSRPVQIALEHERTLCRHGLATLMRAKRAEGGLAAMLWLADPFIALPPHPAAGASWEPEVPLAEPLPSMAR
jgi:hypothetical protein